MPIGLLIARCARGNMSMIRPFAGEAGLLGACSHFSDTFLARSRHVGVDVAAPGTAEDCA